MRPPPAEVRVDAEMVAALVADQHADLATLPVRFCTEGFDNTMWHLGEDLLVRLPRRALAAPLAIAEQRWLPGLARRLPLPIPAPVRTGVPALGYPWRWSIVPLLPGSPASRTGPLGERAAGQLAGFLRALHVPAPRGAPTNPWRGVPLARRAAAFDERVAELDAGLAAPARTAWADALAIEPWGGEPTWVHGDLHPGNVLVADGEIRGVVDFGDLCRGDPSTDLAAAWMLFDEPLARSVLTASGADEGAGARALGWALHFGVLLATIEDDPLGLRAAGQVVLRRVLAVGDGL